MTCGTRLSPARSPRSVTSQVRITSPYISKGIPVSLPLAAQRDLARRCAATPGVRGRPPSRPLVREARAFLALRRAPTRAATPTISTFRFPLSEKRATRTRASGRLAGCVFKYSVKTPRMARSADPGYLGSIPICGRNRATRPFRFERNKEWLTLDKSIMWTLPCPCEGRSPRIWACHRRCERRRSVPHSAGSARSLQFDRAADSGWPRCRSQR